jgi:hypothetical protein
MTQSMEKPRASASFLQSLSPAEFAAILRTLLIGPSIALR